MNRKMDIGSKNLRDFVAGSLATMNLITMFGMACREAGILIPELKPALGSGTRAHGKGKRGRLL